MFSMPVEAYYIDESKVNQSLQMMLQAIAEDLNFLLETGLEDPEHGATKLVLLEGATRLGLQIPYLIYVYIIHIYTHIFMFVYTIYTIRPSQPLHNCGCTNLGSGSVLRDGRT